MLRRRDATTETDRRIAEALGRWSARAPEDPPPGFTSEEKAAEMLRALMEQDGRTSDLRSVMVNGRDAFIYVCRSPDLRPYAQGLGSTPVLAVCDAFLARATDETRRSTHAPASRSPGSPRA